MTISVAIPPAHASSGSRSFFLPSRPFHRATQIATLKGELRTNFNGFTYSPFDHAQVATAVAHLLDFATERYLWDGYEAFIPNLLSDYPEPELERVPYNPLDSALLTAYSEGFYYPTFEKWLALIRNQYAIPLPYESKRLLALLRTTYEWGCAHADQFRDTSLDMFTSLLTANPAAPGYAFILACNALGLPFDKWAGREARLFAKEFNYFLPSMRSRKSAAKSTGGKSLVELSAS